MNKNKKKYLIAVAAFIVCFIMFVFAIRIQRMYANNVTNEQTKTEKTQSNAENNKSKEVKDTKSEQENKKTEDKAAKKVSTTGDKAPEVKAEDNKNKEKDNTQTNNKSSVEANQKNTETSSAAQTAPRDNIKVKADDPEEQHSFQFIDTVHGNNVFLKKNVDDMEGETVGYITERLLDEAKINYKATGSASTLYFAAINGLEEKKAGKLSGWCYYVRKNGEDKFQKPNVGSGQWIYHKGDIIVWKYLEDGIHDGYSDDWMK